MKKTILSVLMLLISLLSFAIGTVEITSPAANEQFAKKTFIAVKASYTDAAEVTAVNVSLINSGSGWAGPWTASGVNLTAPFDGTIDMQIAVPGDFPVYNTPEGSNTIQYIQVTVTYADGNANPYTLVQILPSETPDIKGEVTITSPAANAQYAKKTSIPVEATYTMPEAVSKVSITLVNSVTAWSGAWSSAPAVVLSAPFDGVIDTAIFIPGDFAEYDTPSGSNTVQFVQVEVTYTDGKVNPYTLVQIQPSEGPVLKGEVTIEAPIANSEYQRGTSIPVKATYTMPEEVSKVTMTLINSGYAWTGPWTSNLIEIPAPYDGTIDAEIAVPVDFPLYDTPLDSNTVQYVQLEVTYTDGKVNPYSLIKIRPGAVAATGVSVSPESTNLQVGATVTPIATMVPADADNQKVIWTSDDTDVATVNDSTGVVTGVSVGVANIIATTDDGGFSDKCVVSVTATSIPVTGVSLDLEATELDKSGKLMLNPIFTPLSASNKNVTWTSLTTSVATVDDNGEVTGVDLGSSMIVVETEDGTFKDTCEITVVKAASFTFDDKSKYVGPEFETGSKMSVTVNYAMGANRAINENGLNFRLRHLNSAWEQQTYDYLYNDKSFAGSQSGSATHDIDLTDAPLTAEMAEGDFYYLWINCKDDAGTVREVQTYNTDVILIVATANGIREVEHRMSVYPNPAEDLIYINGMQGVIDVSIYNLDGRIILKNSLGTSRRVDVSQLKQGNYIMQVRDELGFNAQMITIK